VAVGVVVPLPQALALAVPQALREAVALCEKVPQAVPLTVGVKLTLSHTVTVPEGV
jgi:hypothetical protein